jgi:hypothetical protein
MKERRFHTGSTLRARRILAHVDHMACGKLTTHSVMLDGSLAIVSRHSVNHNHSYILPMSDISIFIKIYTTLKSNGLEGNKHTSA